MGLFNRRSAEPFVAAATAVIKANTAGRNDPSLAKRVATYLETGEGESVLAAVDAAVPNWWMSRWDDDERRRRQALYALLDDAPPEQGVRWARVVAAGTRHFYPELLPLAGGDWAECLIHDLTRSYHYAASRGREAVPVRIATLATIIEAGGGARTALVRAMFGPTRTTMAYSSGTRMLLRTLVDYPPAVQADSEQLAALAVDAPPGIRDKILDNLEPVDDGTLALFASALALYSVDGASTITTATEQLARRCPEPAMSAALREIATTAKRGRHVARPRRVVATGPARRRSDLGVADPGRRGYDGCPRPGHHLGGDRIGH